MGGCLALRGGTDYSDCTWFWDSGLTGCVIDLAGVVDRVLGEIYDSVPKCEHQNEINEGARLQFSCERMVVGVPHVFHSRFWHPTLQLRGYTAADGLRGRVGY